MSYYSIWGYSIGKGLSNIQGTWDQLPTIKTLTLTRCIIVGKSLKISVPFLIYETKSIIIIPLVVDVKD